ncbi:hypothetical protein F5B21DRAFT_510154 [Xylaria acuta]|nr:hypothetical protein F5B21DRAFT_510154 [Xylaria acuta]
MSPTYTMSAHLCKEIYKSFQNRQTSPEPSPPNGNNQAPSSWTTPAKRTSVDSDRSDSSSASGGAPMSRSSSSSGWGWRLELGELAFTEWNRKYPRSTTQF